MATYFVSTTGNDTTGTGSQLSPWRTINKGLTTMAAGDTLFLRGGTYVESIGGTATKSGISDAVRTTIQGYQSEAAIIQPSTGNATFGDAVSFYQRSYILFKSLRVNSQNVANYAIGMAHSCHHIRIDSCIVNSPGVGINASRDQTTDRHHLDWVNNTITLQALGTPGFVHAMYMRGTHDCLVEGNTATNSMGYAIFMAKYQNGTTPRIVNNIIRLNRFYGNGSRGIDIEGGDNVLIYNNLIYDNNIAPDSVAGIFIANGSVGTLIYNNTIVGNKGNGIWLQTGSSNSVLRNNIIYNNTGGAISNAGTNTLQSNNLTTNPTFVDLAAKNFHLQSSSAARDTGFNLSSVFTTDYDNVVRANGTTTGTQWDIGAYEYVSGTSPSPPAAPTGLAATTS